MKRMTHLRAGFIFVLLLAFLVIPGFQAHAAKYTIGVALPFWQNFLALVQEGAKAYDIEIVYADAESREEKELSIIENFISRGVDGMLITPVTASIGPAMMRKAESAGIPVVFVERWAGIAPDKWTGDQYVGFVGGDYGATGYQMMQVLYNAGARRVVAIGGAQGNSVADELSASVRRFVKEHPDMKLLREQRNAELREHGLRIGENFLSAFRGPGFDGVWAFNDETALGAIQALKNAKRLDKVAVVGKDLISDAVGAIKRGEMVYSFGGQWASSAFVSLAMLYDHLNGHPPKQRLVYVPLLGVGKDDVAKYSQQFIDRLPPVDFKAITQTHNPKFTLNQWTLRLK